MIDAQKEQEGLELQAHTVRKDKAQLAEALSETEERLQRAHAQLGDMQQAHARGEAALADARGELAAVQAEASRKEVAHAQLRSTVDQQSHDVDKFAEQNEALKVYGR
jgi:chromosome segregation ATPase